MKIHLLTGSTGFIGQYLLKTLLQHNQTVWIIVRPLNKLSAEERGQKIFSKLLLKYPRNLRVIGGDITIKNCGISLSNLKYLQKHAVFFWHLAANLSFNNEHSADIKQTNILGTKNVTGLANRIAKKIIYTSTAYVCGDSSSFQENDLGKGQKFRNLYEETKFAAEQYLQVNSHIPYTIFRPSIIIGDTYQGKAEGCTFGYYRYTFIIYFLKQQIISQLSKKGFLSACLKILGTKYNAKDDILTVPSLLIPYPIGGQVDLIPVDYVINAMFDLYDKFNHSQVIHLTNPYPPKYIKMFKAVLEDIGLEKIKAIPLPPVLFKLLVTCAHFCVPSIRKYSKSVMWYIPYISKRCHFGHTTIKKYYHLPPKITRQTMRRINTYANENILNKIDIT